MHEHSRLVKSENTDLDKSYAHIHKITMGLEGRVSSLGGAGRDYAGGDDIFEDDKISVSDFRFLPQMFGGAILLPISKIAPPNGSYVQDAMGTAVADQCRILLICSAKFSSALPSTGFCSQFA